MGAWASATAARDDLRRFLNDGVQDRPVKGKPIVGRVDGVNKRFVTWDDRLIEATVEVQVNGQPAAVTVIDSVFGELELTTAPTVQQTLRAFYYFQFFLDAELDEALQLAAGEIVESDDVTMVPVGLKTATLYFAASFGFEKQSLRWAQRLSNRFKLEDEPVDKDTTGRPQLFKDWSTEFMEKAMTYRDNYYQRHGRRNVPSFGRTSPVLPSIAPRR